MAFTPPDLTDFLSRHPEFGSIDPDLVVQVLGEALNEVDESWIERDRPRAILLLTAHRLVREGALLRSTGALDDGTGATIKREEVGDVEVEYNSFNFATGGKAGSYRETLALTRYGREFLILQRRSFPGIGVV